MVKLHAEYGYRILQGIDFAPTGPPSASTARGRRGSSGRYRSTVNIPTAYGRGLTRSSDRVRTSYTSFQGLMTATPAAS